MRCAKEQITLLVTPGQDPRISSAKKSRALRLTVTQLYLELAQITVCVSRIITYFIQAQPQAQPMLIYLHTTSFCATHG
jgi:hypothetical protein